jgi:hypothetical protein
MSNVVRKLSKHADTSLDTGSVYAREGLLFHVRTATHDISVQRAKSCLVEPEVGDEVLIAGGGKAWWILAVLEGAEGAASRLVATGDLEIYVPNGRVSLTSGEGIDLTAREEISVASKSFDLHAVDVGAVFKRMTLIGARLQADLESVKAIAGAIDSVVERITQRAKRVYRFVEEFDQLRAEHIDYSANKNASVRGENTVMTAQECVKIDGEQVHIG